MRGILLFALSVLLLGQIDPLASQVSNNRPTIVIDAGHGGVDGGARTSDGMFEKTLNLQAAYVLAAALSNSGFDVQLTRSTDELVSFADRIAQVAEHGAVSLVSIHTNGMDNDTHRGGEILVRADDAASVELGQVVANALSDLPVSFGVREGRPIMLRETNVPAILLELGMMTNPAEAAIVAELEYQRAVADRVAAAMSRHLR